MKKARIATSLLSLLLVLTLLAGCGATGAGSSMVSSAPAASTSLASSSSASATTITDSSGREVTLPEKVEKIVALTASDCEILYALGAGDAIVGRGAYCNYPPEIEEKPVVQSGEETNIEEIIALQPDVVVMSVMAQTTEQVEAMENAGLPVVVTDAQSIDGTYALIDLLGQVTQKEREAAALIQEMQAGFDEIQKQVDSSVNATAYFEVSPLEYGLWTTGQNTFMDEIATMLGLTNSFADVEDWAEVSEEQVLERNPDYIFTVAMYFGEGPTPDEEILSRPGWQNISAVANNNVYVLENDPISRPGPRLVQAAQAIADIVYPQ